jgi:hypothetical protein
MDGYSSQYLDAPGDLNWSLFFAWVLGMDDRLIIQAAACSAAASVLDSDG